MRTISSVQYTINHITYLKIKLLVIVVIIFIFPLILAEDNPITPKAIETDLFEEAVDFIIAHEG